MLEIAICDDERVAAADIEKMTEEMADMTATGVNTEVFYDGSTLVDYIQKGKRYDIIYLDIEMFNQNGVEAAREIRKMDARALIIYITGHESFAKDAFEVSAFRFITKPIDRDIFRKYFLDAKREILGHMKYFRYQYNKISYRLPIDEIMYFQSEKRITYIVTAAGSRKCYEKLNDIEKRLVESGISFYRTNQSFLVNPQYVCTYVYDFMKLWDGTILAVSENRRKDVNKLFCEIKGEDIIV